MNKILLAAVVCLLASIGLNPAINAQNKPVNLSGTWQINFNDDNGVSRSSPKLVLTQSGDKLTGTFGLYDWPVVGAVDGNHVVFSFVAYGHEKGQAISDTVFYWGTIENGVKMKGRMKNPKEAGDWIANRR